MKTSIEVQPEYREYDRHAGTDALLLSVIPEMSWLKITFNNVGEVERAIREWARGEKFENYFGEDPSEGQIENLEVRVG